MGKGPTTASMLAAALQYAARGWPVIPIHPRSKRPLIKWGKGASTDPATIEAWWAQWPSANVAIKTGVEADLAVLDIDSAIGWNHLQQALQAAGAPIPDTYAVRSGRSGGGVHLYFTLRQPQRSLKLLQDGKPILELKADGSYVLAPPSIHEKTQNLYTVINDKPITPLPQHIIKLFQPHERSRYTHTTGTRPVPEYFSRLPRDSRITQFLKNFCQPTAATEKIAYYESSVNDFDPDLPREAWIIIGMALKSLEIVGEGGIDQGLEIWDAWSSEATHKYRGRSHIEEQWASFKGRPPGEEVTWGSVEMLKREHPEWLRRSPHKQNESSTFNGHPSADTFTQKAVDNWIDAGDLLAQPATPPAWLVDRWIPADDVTMLSGDGGVGKSTLALQLALAAITNTSWLNLPVSPGNVLYLSAEDRTREIHWRLQQIHKHTRHALQHHLQIKDLANLDATLALFDRNENIQATPLFHDLATRVELIKPKLIILDAAADIYGGEEMVRRQVALFIRMLRTISLQYDMATLFLAHPSVDAMKTGRGYSGSTQWNNSVRSRLFFTKAEQSSEFGPPNPDLRTLTNPKNNRSRGDDVGIQLIWQEGRFVTTTREAAVNPELAKAGNAKFLALLDLATRQGIALSHRERSNNYAPLVMSRYPSAQGWTKDMLVQAMYRLLETGTICLEAYGAPSDQTQKIILRPPQ